MWGFIKMYLPDLRCCLVHQQQDRQLSQRRGWWIGASWCVSLSELRSRMDWLCSDRCWFYRASNVFVITTRSHKQAMDSAKNSRWTTAMIRLWLTLPEWSLSHFTFPILVKTVTSTHQVSDIKSGALSKIFTGMMISVPSIRHHANISFKI